MRHRQRLVTSAVVCWIAQCVTLTSAALSAESKAQFAGTWKGTFQSLLIGVWPRPLNAAGNALPISINKTLEDAANNPIEQLRPACLTEVMTTELIIRFDTSADVFVFVSKPLTVLYRGESMTIPPIRTTGKVVSYDWEQHMVTFQSPHMADKQSCWSAIFDINSSVPLLKLSTTNTFDGTATESCPSYNYLRCNIKKDPPDFSTFAELSLLSAAEATRVNDEEDIGGTVVHEPSTCQRPGANPWDLLVPVDCWSQPPPEEMPLWMVVLFGAGMVLCYCGCCITCWMWCWNTFVDKEAFWRNRFTRCCCCGCIRLYRQYRRMRNLPVAEDPRDLESLNGSSVEMKKRKNPKIEAFKPDWARKYGDHAKGNKNKNVVTPL